MKTWSQPPASLHGIPPATERRVFRTGQGYGRACPSTSTKCVTGGCPPPAPSSRISCSREKVRLSKPFVLAQVLLPGADVEALDEAVGVGEVPLEHPVHRPIAEADLPQLLHPRDVIGASSVDQLEQNVAALDNLSLSADELAEINRHVTADGSVDLWREVREGAL